MTDWDGEQEVLEKNAFEESADFLVNSNLEKSRIFRDLMKTGTMITCYFAGGDDFILSSVIHVDADRELVVFELGKDSARNKRMIESNRITGVTTHNQVKVQFICESLKPCKYQGEEALCCDFPERLLRMQRREAFRQSIPRSLRVKCRLKTERGDSHELELFDISAGGVCLVDNSAELEFEMGEKLPTCIIPIPEQGSIISSVEVRNSYDVRMATGKEVRRIGFGFVNLPPQMNAMIQRFIVSIERERRRLASAD